MQPVIVRIVCTEAFKLFVEKTQCIASFLNENHRELRCDRKAFTGMPLHQRLPQRPFTLPAVIDIGRIEIGKTV